MSASSLEGASPPVGLSHVHIPSLAMDGILKGEVRSGEFVICQREDEGHVDHPTGPGHLSIGAHWRSIRRWRSGLSLGVGPVLDGRRKGRGEVRGFSEGSGRRMRRYLGECEAEYICMGTLTVGADWSRDPAEFRSAVDRWLGIALRDLKAEHLRHGESPDLASIFWFVEFQARGAPHLHIYYTRWMHWEHLARRWHSLCVRFHLCGEDETNMWKTSTRFERIRGGYRGMLAYASKYAGKIEQKQVPADYPWRGRFWGVRGNRTRVSFHIVCTTDEPAARRMKGLEIWLDERVEAGELRKLRWKEGDGAIWFPTGGRQWTETGELGRQLEVRLARIALEAAPCPSNAT